MFKIYVRHWKDMLQFLFQLFDRESKNQLVQSDFVEFLKIKLG